MLYAISSGLAAQVEDDCWHESASVSLTDFCTRHAYVKPTSLSAPRLFGYVSIEVQAHLLELRTLSEQGNVAAPNDATPFAFAWLWTLVTLAFLLSGSFPVGAASASHIAGLNARIRMWAHGREW